MDEFVFGNMAWNAGLVTVAGYLIKRWMGSIESQLKSFNNKIENKDMQIESELKERTQLYEERENKLYTKIDGIYTQLKEANRRTSKNEEQIHIQAVLCAERTKHGQITCIGDAGNKELEVLNG